MSDLWWERESRSGTTMVLLHEGAGSSQVWHALRPKLSASGRTVAVYDRRGYGQSPHDNVWTSSHFDAAAADLARLLPQIADEPVDLLGHSDGGSVALLLAARHPELVHSLVIVDTHVYADPVTVSGLCELGRPAEWDERTRDRYERQHGRDWLSVVRGWLDMWTDGTLAGWDIRPTLDDIACPVLVIHDRGDRLSPVEHAESIAQRVPTCTVRWYDAGTHRPHVSDPERFVNDIDEFTAALG